MKPPRHLFWLTFIATIAVGIIILSAFVYQSWPREERVLALVEVDPSIIDRQDAFFERLIPLMDTMLPTSSLPKNLRHTSSTVASKFDVPFGILMYHHIDADPKFTARKLSVTPEDLERQISFLLGRGYHFVTLDQAFEYFIRDGHTPLKTLVLTFDDGYRSFYTAAFPILEKYQIPASVYVINQDIGKRGNLTVSMMKELIKSGLVEIGVHTVNHKILSRLNEADQRFQLGESKKELESMLGIPMTTVVYPFGNYNATTTRLAADVGFKGGASVYFGKKPSAMHLYDWRRVQIQNKDQGEGLLRLLYAAFVVVK